MNVEENHTHKGSRILFAILQLSSVILILMGTITIQGVTHTGEKKFHAHSMVFEMHRQNLGPTGDFSVSFQLGAHVDPSTLEHLLANGVLKGVVKNNKKSKDPNSSSQRLETPLEGMPA
ncbi:Alpha crystallin/Hsp20 domain-containing protein [Artemisia annua]|uniref:Alpha crystallin/Hsp20 domain-containing protein n=1 Tax=Artemisia annua TaxID=35608 RepID=A0A2U1KL72_ARTAN|nr:Alpha crystallin/Hsp20 domain-containing protein [Artemisia annua]